VPLSRPYVTYMPTPYLMGVYNTLVVICRVTVRGRALVLSRLWYLLRTLGYRSAEVELGRFRDQAMVLPTLPFWVSLVVVVLAAKMICGSRVRPFQRSSNGSAHPPTDSLRGGSVWCCPCCEDVAIGLWEKCCTVVESK